MEGQSFHIPRTSLSIQAVTKISTESSKYYARIQTAVARGLCFSAGWLAGHQTDAASQHSLCYFSLFSEKMVTRIDEHLQSGIISVYWLWLLLDVSVLIVIIAICDMPRQEFSFCEHVYSQYVISVIFLLFIQTSVSCDKRFRYFWSVCSNLSPISSNVSSVRTWRWRFTFLFFTEPISLNLLACLLILLGYVQVLLEILFEIFVFQNTTFCFSYTYCEYTHVHTMRIPV